MIQLRPGQFDVVLVIDQREANLQRGAFAILQSTLAAHKIPYSLRMLPIGDFLWVCREKTKSLSEGDSTCRGGGHGVSDSPVEITLGYLVERKREDDLYSSIIDGRYQEQKARIRSAQIGRVIYLIERFTPGSYSRRTNLSIGSKIPSQKTICSVLSSTLIHDNFIIHRSCTFEETVLFIVSLTNWISKKIENKSIVLNDNNELYASIPTCELGHSLYNDFCRKYGRQSGMKLRDLFVSQLNCISSISVERAVVIAEKYPTLQCLWLAFEQSKNQDLLSELTLPNGRKLGEKSSRLVYSVIYKKEREFPI